MKVICIDRFRCDLCDFERPKIGDEYTVLNQHEDNGVLFYRLKEMPFWNIYTANKFAPIEDDLNAFMREIQMPLRKPKFTLKSLIGFLL